MTRGILRALAVLLAFGVLAVAWTWPLAAHLRSAYVYPHGDVHLLAAMDSRLVSWMLAWGAHALRTAPLGLFDAPIFHPLPQALTLSEHLLADVLLVLPVDVLFGDPVLDHNVAVLATFAIGGAGTTFLLRELGTGWTAAFAGGVLFAFGPLRLAELGHLQTLSTHWMPLALLALHRFLRTRGRGAGLAFVACLALQALSSVYYAYYFGLAVGLFLLLHGVLRCPAAPRARLQALGLAALAAALVAPTLLPYAANRERLGLARSPLEVFLNSSLLEHWVGVALGPRRYLRERFLEWKPVYPLLGFGMAVVLATAAAGLRRMVPARRRDVLLYGGLALGMIAISLGPRITSLQFRWIELPGPHALLAALVPGLDALRGPGRAAAPALLACAVVAGLGVDQVARRLRGRAARLGAGVALVAALAVESWHPPLATAPAATLRDRPASYAWLAGRAEHGAVVVLPLGDPLLDARAMVWSGAHWKPIVNGASGFAPATAWLRGVLAGFPDEQSRRLLADLRVRWIVVHPRDLPGGAALCDVAHDGLRLRHRDATACVLELAGVPPSPPRPADRPVPLASLRVSTSGGDDAAAAIDGSMATRWAQPVDAAQEAWLAITLPQPLPLTRLVLHLGPSFGDRPRIWRIDTSPDGRSWTSLGPPVIAPAPLAQLRTSPEALTIEVPLGDVVTQHVRLVIPAATPSEPWDLRAGWQQWGLRELEVRTAADGAGGADAGRR